MSVNNLEMARERYAIARMNIAVMRTAAIAIFPGQKLGDIIEHRFVLAHVLIGHVEKRPVTVSKLERATGLPRATVRRRLALLMEFGYVKKHGNIYCMGHIDPKTLRTAVLRQIEIIKVTAKELAKLTNST